MDEMKKYKLKLDYTADELEELKRLGKNTNSPLNAAARIVESASGDGLFRNLGRKYAGIDYKDEFDFMKDINNAVMGTAIFPEEKYVVHDKVTDQYIYCNVLAKGELHWWKLGVETAEIKTKEEWLEINPAYEPMLERVGD